MPDLLEMLKERAAARDPLLRDALAIEREVDRFNQGLPDNLMDRLIAMSEWLELQRDQSPVPNTMEFRAAYCARGWLLAQLVQTLADRGLQLPQPSVEVDLPALMVAWISWLADAQDALLDSDTPSAAHGTLH